MRKWLLLLGVGLWLWPSSSLGVAREDFLIIDTQDVLDVCTVAESDPMYTASIAFCHGYLLGAYQYHVAMFGRGDSKPVVCFPDPPPSRVQAIDQFIAWVKASPARVKERPADALTEFLVETWPCTAGAVK